MRKYKKIFLVTLNGSSGFFQRLYRLMAPVLLGAIAHFYENLESYRLSVALPMIFLVLQRYFFLFFSSQDNNNSNNRAVFIGEVVSGFNSLQMSVVVSRTICLLTYSYKLNNCRGPHKHLHKQHSCLENACNTRNM
jgi:hypothetical protein